MFVGNGVVVSILGLNVGTELEWATVGVPVVLALLGKNWLDLSDALVFTGVGAVEPGDDRLAPRRNSESSLSNTVWSPMTAATAEAPTTNPPTAISAPLCFESLDWLTFDWLILT